ncbi:MAG: hypothetical protein U5K75_02450 [Ahrensia sp.]|nr:hypothetical protein [Ahrensia sp.]
MTMGNNSDFKDFDVLPSSVQDIAEALGIGLVFKLVEHFGGVELRIPHKIHEKSKIDDFGA